MSDCYEVIITPPSLRGVGGVLIIGSEERFPPREMVIAVRRHLDAGYAVQIKTQDRESWIEVKPELMRQLGLAEQYAQGVPL
jgi:hypothetical protein